VLALGFSSDHPPLRATGSWLVCLCQGSVGCRAPRKGASEAMTDIPAVAWPTVGVSPPAVHPSVPTCCAFEGASRRRSAWCYRAPPSGFSKDRPSIDIIHRCPLPAASATSGSLRSSATGWWPSAGRCKRPARSVLVVSHHLDGFLHRRRVGLLHPTADPGVHRVSASHRTIASWCVAWGLPRRCHALQSFPYPYSRTRVTASRCPPAVVGRVPGFTGVPLDFKALLRTSIRCDGPPLPELHARCSPGLPVLELHVRRPAGDPTERPKPLPGGSLRPDPLGGPGRRACVPSPSACEPAGEGWTARGRRDGAAHVGGTSLPGPHRTALARSSMGGVNPSDRRPGEVRQAHGTEALAATGRPLRETGGGGDSGRTSCPRLGWRRRPLPPGTREGPMGKVTVNRAQQGGGSEATLARPTLAGPSHLLRHTARQRCATVRTRVATRRTSRVRASSGRVMEVGSPRRTMPVSRIPSGRASPPLRCLLGAIRVSSRWRHRGRLRHTCGPPCGRRPPLPVGGGGDAGQPSRADRRAPRPRCVLADLDLHRRSCRCSRSPRRPVVNRSRAPTRVPHAPASRPCRASSCSSGSANRPSGWSNIRPDRSRPTASARRCAGLFARTQGRSLARDVTREQLTTGRTSRTPARHRTWRLDLDDACSRRPCGRRSTDTVPLPFARRCRRSAPGTGCPMAVGGRGAPGPLPAPSEGVATLAGRDRGKWSSARARVAGSGRRRGRHGLGRPSPRGLACVAGRCVRASPLAGTRWAGAEVRRPTRCGG
jgi:hypothetical protein